MVHICFFSVYPREFIPLLELLLVSNFKIPWDLGEEIRGRLLEKDLLVLFLVAAYRRAKALLDRANLFRN